METRREEAAPTRRLCAECGSVVTTSWHSHSFQCGSGAAAVDLTVRLPVRRCNHCDFDYLDNEGERIMHEAVCRHLGVLTPREIRSIRERHGVSRAAFAKVTGIGEASLSRWEKGIKIQNPANDRYLRLLAQPGMIAILKGTIGGPLLESRPATFRQIEVSEALRKRQSSFRLRPRTPLARVA